jgi:hypothetical protein
MDGLSATGVLPVHGGGHRRDGSGLVEICPRRSDAAHLQPSAIAPFLTKEADRKNQIYLLDFLKWPQHTQRISVYCCHLAQSERTAQAAQIVDGSTIGPSTVPVPTGLVWFGLV